MVAVGERLHCFLSVTLYKEVQPTETHGSSYYKVVEKKHCNLSLTGCDVVCFKEIVLDKIHHIAFTSSMYVCKLSPLNIKEPICFQFHSSNLTLICQNITYKEDT